MSVGVAAGQPLTDSAGPLLEVGGLQAEYGDIPVLWDLSLTVRAGEILALVGANGAGKTTLLNSISGVLRPTAGQIFFDGREITREDSSRIVTSGLTQVPEGRRLFPFMTVEENLRLGAYSSRARSQMEETLAAVLGLFPVLGDRLGQLAGSLSGGEQQMAAIGRALMGRPRLLMLDEPVLGLAPAMVQLVFEKIQELKRTGVTVLLVEQNVREALQLAERGFVVERGSIVLSGTGGELLANPSLQKAYLGL